MPTYARFPLALVRGRGSWVWDADGRRYLDFVGGIAVTALGHGPRGLASTVARQIDRLVHVSNLYHTEAAGRLAELLVKAAFPSKVFFCHSGTEANEAALKLARKYAHGRDGADRSEIVAMENSFHGRTYGSLSATGQSKYQVGFEPLVPGFLHVPFNDFATLDAATGPRTAAVIVEPIQAEGGVRVPSSDYLRRVRGMCDRKGIVLIFDEVQTGLGRTGRAFAFQHFGVRPDILTLGKSLGGGLPMAAMLARDEVVSAFGPGSHAVTMGGSPAVAVAALWAMKRQLAPALLRRAAAAGAYLRSRLERLRCYPAVQDVRGMGLLQAIELDRPARPVVETCVGRGVLLTVLQERVVRFLPPLTVKRNELDRAVAVLDRVLAETGGTDAAASAHA
ncbi:MAG: aspartate aminotransferase family protein [Nitrospirae bacterium]|nr:aspartate aminotransferase family protein [Nitrospirota bacterium]